MEKPQITFIVAAWNQANFIRQAAESALAQTYSPLEVILSDDGSTDATFEVMKAVAAEYKGPHKIRLNRNERASGIAGHINQLMEMIQSDFTVVGAGDDISVPWRVEALYQAWSKSGGRAVAIHSRALLIDEKGEPISHDEYEQAINWKKPAESDISPLRVEVQKTTLAAYVDERNPKVNGCTFAWSSELRNTFGPIQPKVTNEDVALVFRSLMLRGEVHFVDAPLVLWRMHGRNTCLSRDEIPRTLEEVERGQRRMKTRLDREVALHEAMLEDLDRALQKGVITQPVHAEAKMAINRKHAFYKGRRALMDAKLGTRLRLIFELSRGPGGFANVRDFLWRLLPNNLYCRAQLWKGRLFFSRAR